LPGAAAPANDARGFRWLRPLLGLALVAAVLLAVGPRLLSADDAPRLSSPMIKAGEALTLYQLTGEALTPYQPGTALGAGDVVGIRVRHQDHRGVVVLSVDGNGTVSTFWPEAGERPEPLPFDGEVPLPGTVILDGAPGPEVFVAVFDAPVSEARAELERRYREGGPDAVLAWAEAEAGVAAVEIARR
jgi:hypothetical protein